MADGRAAEGIRRRGLRDDVHERLLQLLLSGDIVPGERLAIDTIARQLAVSPTPVREALALLERTGLVTREALKGYRAAPPLGVEQLAELFEARLMLEVTAARLATPADDDMLRRLRAAEDAHTAAGERIITALSAGDRDLALTTDYFAKDVAFHRVILDRSGNRYIEEMSDTLAAQIHRMRQMVPYGVTDVRDAIAEHEVIVAAFASADPDAPERAMRAHIEGVRARSLKHARELAARG
ncbi:GntR family transcriptional regulator [Microbacterium sp.]|uniref:GntR family transcriptional regulator n=1 Tax=Microbacterium sp. TaxID=51671 RepID=UPI003221EAAC